jgi:hypothetical protein
VTNPPVPLKWRFASALTLLLMLAVFVAAALKAFKTDDAFMFYRYVLHFREGLGISWNSDAIPTYGLTSLGWFFVVLFFSFLPVKPVAVLVIASGAAFAAAALVMTYAISSHARSRALRSAWVAFPLAALPLLLQPYFDLEILNGMETMLSFLANVLIVFAALSLLRNPSFRNGILLGVAGYFAFFVRPDNGLCAALVPALLWLLSPGMKLKYSAAAEACLFALIGVQLFVAHQYFGTPVPLAFYLKSLHGYRGYISPINPGIELSRFLFMAAPYLLLCCVIVRRRADLRFLAIFATPVLLTCLYLLTVLQIMGNNARYYVPFLPFIVLPSVMLLDRWLAEDPEPAKRSVSGTKIAVGISGIAFVLVAIFVMSNVWGKYSARHIVRYREPERIIAATRPLPVSNAIVRTHQMGDSILRFLPKGTLVAASEVGYIGSSAPQVNIIDLVGLNDREIAMQGFSMSRLLQRAPDLIWLPHQDYTWLRREIWTDPDFLAQYDIYDGAVGYGVAIRKASPLHDAIEKQVATAWPHLFPNTNMNDYLVQGLKPDQGDGHIAVAAR